MESVFSVLLLIAVPWAIKKAEHFKLIKIFSPVAVSYFAGFVFVQLPLPYDKQTIEITAYVSIALSISLLVFNSELNRFRVMLGPLLKAFFLGILSLFIALTLSFFIVAKFIPNGAEILGMLTGVYVGGTPNLNAIALALEVPSETIVLVNTAEIVYSGIYFLLMITILKPFLNLFLRKYQHTGVIIEESNGLEKTKKHTLLKKLKYAGTGILLSLAIIVLSYEIIMYFYDEINIAGVLLLVTTLSISLAQNKYVKKLPLKFETADFLLLIFSFGIGLQVDFANLFSKGLEIYLLTGMVFASTLLIHFILAYLTKTDTDTLMISSTAAIFGPAFIGPVAIAIKNRELIFYGITLGLLGYILGNYLGISVAWIFQWLMA